MKKMKRLLSFALVVVLSMSLIGCGSKKEDEKEKSATSKNASEKSAKELLLSATDKMKENKDLESLSAKIEFSINVKEKATDKKDKAEASLGGLGSLGDLSKIAAKGTIDISAFVKDMKVKAACNMDLNGEKNTYEGYITDKAVTFTLDGKKYQSLTFSTLSTLGINADDTVGEIKKSASGEATASPEQEKQLKKAEDMISKWADSFKIDGTKDINGDKANVVKGTLNKDNIKEFMSLAEALSGTAKESLGSLGSLTEGAEDMDIPEDFKGVDFELYVSDKDNTIVGMKVDLTSSFKASKDTEVTGDNYLIMTWGYNNAEKFDVPKGEEVDLTGLLSLFSGDMGEEDTKEK